MKKKRFVAHISGYAFLQFLAFVIDFFFRTSPNNFTKKKVSFCVAIILFFCFVSISSSYTLFPWDSLNIFRYVFIHTHTHKPEIQWKIKCGNVAICRTSWFERKKKDNNRKKNPILLFFVWTKSMVYGVPKIYLWIVISVPSKLPFIMFTPLHVVNILK